MSVSKKEMKGFAAHLKSEDRCSGTIDKYLRDSAEFSAWLGTRKLTRENTAAWREHLVNEGYLYRHCEAG